MIRRLSVRHQELVFIGSGMDGRRVEGGGGCLRRRVELAAGPDAWALLEDPSPPERGSVTSATKAV